LYNITLMLTGYNTDFKFQGRIYHVQTEDGGLSSPSITSLLYYQGAVLASRKTSYADIIKADCLEEVVRELMMEQHKQMIRDLMHGKLEVQNPPQQPASAEQKGGVNKNGLGNIVHDLLAQGRKEQGQNK